MKIKSIKLAPVIGIGYWKDVYSGEATGFEGVTHNIILPFVKISLGYVVRYTPVPKRK